jgi:hypothetical protein
VFGLRVVAAAALAVLLGMGAATAGQRVGDFMVFSETGDTIALNSEIDTGSIADFHKALAMRPKAKVVLLHSPGGDVDAALALAAEIRQRGLSTAIPNDFACYSACTFLFFAGKEHVVRGKLGVHRVSMEGLDDTGAAGVYDGDVRQALTKYGCPNQVIKAMVSTPPSQLHVFSHKEITAFAINRAVGKSLASKYAGT